MNSQPLFADNDPVEQPRVLLVDDDEVNLLLTSIALRERGFAACSASLGTSGFLLRRSQRSASKNARLTRRSSSE